MAEVRVQVEEQLGGYLERRRAFLTEAMNKAAKDMMAHHGDFALTDRRLGQLAFGFISIDEPDYEPSDLVKLHMETGNRDTGQFLFIKELVGKAKEMQ